jgi:hypothetical protein
MDRSTTNLSEGAIASPLITSTYCHCDASWSELRGRGGPYVSEQILRTRNVKCTASQEGTGHGVRSNAVLERRRSCGRKERVDVGMAGITKIPCTRDRYMMVSNEYRHPLSQDSEHSPVMSHYAPLKSRTVLPEHYCVVAAGPRQQRR